MPTIDLPGGGMEKTDGAEEREGPQRSGYSGWVCLRGQLPRDHVQSVPGRARCWEVPEEEDSQHDVSGQILPDKGPKM